MAWPKKLPVKPNDTPTNKDHPAAHGAPLAHAALSGNGQAVDWLARMELCLTPLIFKTPTSRICRFFSERSIGLKPAERNFPTKSFPLAGLSPTPNSLGAMGLLSVLCGNTSRPHSVTAQDCLGELPPPLLQWLNAQRVKQSQMIHGKQNIGFGLVLPTDCAWLSLRPEIWNFALGALSAETGIALDPLRDAICRRQEALCAAVEKSAVNAQNLGQHLSASIGFWGNDSLEKK